MHMAVLTWPPAEAVLPAGDSSMDRIWREPGAIALWIRVRVPLVGLTDQTDMVSDGFTGSA
jgi:hypothetical protein